MLIYVNVELIIASIKYKGAAQMDSRGNNSESLLQQEIYKCLLLFSWVYWDFVTTATVDIQESAKSKIWGR